ncbi:PEGA domain-containing protein [Halosquirtibacter laminarini]|uniref:PEGA domain-containing protein n=1 Tax=Halosquirtibacter laminarini TaxID=3374600 RepID=A0AC61NDU1_9BACT|nr:PEGA domain-containing protein [Prolixibacteraceae bacterium]
MKLIKILVVFLLLNSLSSCALLFNGSKQTINISSLTDGSKIYVDGNLVGENNAVTKVTRRTGHTITVKKEGYKSENMLIKSHVQAGWVVFDVCLNWFAFLTDPTTGAWKKFENSNICVDLEKK